MEKLIKKRKNSFFFLPYLVVFFLTVFYGCKKEDQNKNLKWEKESLIKAIKPIVDTSNNYDIKNSINAISKSEIMKYGLENKEFIFTYSQRSNYSLIIINKGNKIFSFKFNDIAELNHSDKSSIALDHSEMVSMFKNKDYFISFIAINFLFPNCNRCTKNNKFVEVDEIFESNISEKLALNKEKDTELISYINKMDKRKTYHFYYSNYKYIYYDKPKQLGIFIIVENDIRDSKTIFNYFKIEGCKYEPYYYSID